MGSHDLQYYQRRYSEEAAKAETVDSPEVRTIHRQLATLYKARAEQLERGSGNGAGTHELNVLRAIMQCD